MAIESETKKQKSEEIEMIVDVVTTIAKEICDHPEAVQVKEIPAQNSSIIEVKVHKEDQGKMIGKQGRTADAIRTIIYAASFKYNKRFTLDIVVSKT